MTGTRQFLEIQGWFFFFIAFQINANLTELFADEFFIIAFYGLHFISQQILKIYKQAQKVAIWYIYKIMLIE